MRLGPKGRKSGWKTQGRREQTRRKDSVVRRREPTSIALLDSGHGQVHAGRAHDAPGRGRSTRRCDLDHDVRGPSCAGTAWKPPSPPGQGAMHQQQHQPDAQCVSRFSFIAEYKDGRHRFRLCRSAAMSSARLISHPPPDRPMSLPGAGVRVKCPLDKVSRIGQSGRHPWQH